jgi:hypothetical protein
LDETITHKSRRGHGFEFGLSRHGETEVSFDCSVLPRGKRVTTTRWAASMMAVFRLWRNFTASRVRLWKCGAGVAYPAFGRLVTAGIADQAWSRLKLIRLIIAHVHAKSHATAGRTDLRRKKEPRSEDTAKKGEDCPTLTARPRLG